jgi:hypothetical protein
MQTVPTHVEAATAAAADEAQGFVLGATNCHAYSVRKTVACTYMAASKSKSYAARWDVWALKFRV